MGRTKSTPRRELTTIASRIGKKLLKGAEASTITVRTTRSAVLSSLRILVAQPAMNTLLYLDAGLESGYEYARGGILAHRHPNRDGVIVTLDQEPDKEATHLYVGANPLRSAQALMKERVLGFLTGPRHPLLFRGGKGAAHTDYRGTAGATGSTETGILVIIIITTSSLFCHGLRPQTRLRVRAKPVPTNIPAPPRIVSPEVAELAKTIQLAQLAYTKKKADIIWGKVEGSGTAQR